MRGVTRIRARRRLAGIDGTWVADGEWIAISIDRSPDSDFTIENKFLTARLYRAPILAFGAGTEPVQLAFIGSS